MALSPGNPAAVRSARVLPTLDSGIGPTITRTSPGLSGTIDVMAWNQQSRPGRPEGAEAQGLRALYSEIARRFG